MNRSTFIAAGAALTLSGCGLPGTPAKVTNLDRGAALLRSAFNDRADDVRLILLVSPN